MKSERKPLLALTASLVMPGLGQVYNGELTKGLSIFLMFAFMMPIFSYIALHAPTSILWVVILLGAIFALVIYVVSVRDAYLSAIRIGGGYQLAAYNKAYAYMAILFFGYFFVLNQLTDYTKTWFVEAFKVPSESMLPNLLRGDHFFVDKRVNYPGAKSTLQRGDASIFVYPNNRTTIYIKRIIGLPGDKIEIKDTEVLVNGKSIRGEEIHNLGNAELNQLLETHLAYKEAGDQGQYIVLWKKDTKHDSSTFTVPNGHVFVLGDNRDQSQDSRQFGSVPMTDVTAKAIQVWLSIDSDIGIRWNRFGKIVKVN